MLKEALRAIETFAHANQSSICMGLASGGIIVTAISSAEAGAKSSQVLEKLRYEHMNLQSEKLTKVDEVKAVARYWAPPIFIGGLTLFAMWHGYRIEKASGIAWATAYSLSEKALGELRESSMEVVGKKKSQEIEEHVAYSRAEKAAKSEVPIIETGKGDYLYMDDFGVIFRSDLNAPARIKNLVNAELNAGEDVALNRLYEWWELPGPMPAIGEHVYFQASDWYPQINIDDSEVIKWPVTGEPMTMIHYDPWPVPYSY